MYVTVIALHKESHLIDVPVLKAWNRIFELVDCFGRYPYNRDQLQDAILALYPGKTEKSVFRGMAIPTLRRLGLIVGFDDLIRLSANGKLVNKASTVSNEFGKRALGTIVYEIDRDELGVLRTLADRIAWLEGEIIEILLPYVSAPSEASKKERIRDWLGLLGYCGITTKSVKGIAINRRVEKILEADADFKRKSVLFKKLLLTSYKRLVARSRGMQFHPIEDLRSEVASTILARYKKILTEKQFDELLRRFPKTSPHHLISFGRSMGADEKLFTMDGKYYQTISIQFFDKQEVK